MAYIVQAGDPVLCIRSGLGAHFKSCNLEESSNSSRQSRPGGYRSRIRPDETKVIEGKE